ncbi:aconitate hydratase [Novosphingobium sp.]|uniref:aconitate hydratase n=1 Tax=Novosphingobium sp. TaxID=1874826 RepID=UPI00352A8730
MNACLTPLSRLSAIRSAALAHLPRSLVILLENVLAHEAEPAPLVARFEEWLQRGEAMAELPFRPARILMQDTAGVAAMADLAALRDHAVAHGHAAGEVDAAIPIDLVIDHSVRVDYSGTPEAATRNLALEYARNGERYRFFKWAEHAFPKFRVVPPGQGICHQINLEMLTNGAVPAPEMPGGWMAETVIGTDSHTTMVNALGVLGWGVGGIEAELAALGAPVPIPLPRVCEVVLTGARPIGVTATDIALHVAARLRAEGVVDQIVEFDGDALSWLSLPDRAAIANMCPEYGATAALFPVDEETLAYLETMGRDASVLAAYRAYALETGLWRGTGPARRYSRSLAIALDEVRPVMAGPHRPQQVRTLSEVRASLESRFPALAPPVDRACPGNGAVAIAAITSCTNTANPEVMLTAGLVARKAIARGLSVPGWVKTSLAPGSRRIAALLRRAGLQDSLDALGFHVVGFGCTTCVGNSGDLKPALTGPDVPDLLVSLLSGNRNFENRIHPAVGANYLASPPLVVAGALAGNLYADLSADPLGHDRNGQPVFLRDIWPDPDEIAHAMTHWRDSTAEVGDTEAWRALDAPCTPQFPWDALSAFIQPPPFFDEPRTGLLEDIVDARALLVLGDNVTTDHISPIGRIQPDTPAAAYLRSTGAAEGSFGSYGDRRANHHVMLRGTFDNARLENRLASVPGNRTVGPDGAECAIHDAAMAFAALGVPAVVLAGENYGTGSARDWAAKGTALLGVRAVIARSFERIHRANLIALGVLPVVVEADLSGVSAAARIALRGIGALSEADRTLVVEILEPGQDEPLRLGARADVWSDSQFAMLRDGGLFAAFRKRFCGM